MNVKDENHLVWGSSQNYFPRILYPPEKKTTLLILYFQESYRSLSLLSLLGGLALLTANGAIL